MFSKDLKYYKLKNLNDVDFIGESYERNKLKNFNLQISEDLLRSKQRVAAVLDKTIKEYFHRVKLEKEISVLYKQQTSVSHKLSELHRKLQIMKEEIEDDNSKRNIHRVFLYEQNLAIRIEPISDLPLSEGEVAISMQFYHINESKPEETCTFVLIITGSNRYRASTCHPPLAEMEELISSLNRTNDLHQFVVNVRKSFRKSFTKSV